MCGILGVWNVDGRPVDARALVAARDKMTPRGPDDAGSWVEGPVGLAHRRLSILDLSPAGRMPMSAAAGAIQCVFNGEIYNFEELRQELSSLGHRFRSTSDSEVVLKAFEQWDTDCFGRFNGMFAIGVWDARNQRCILARDPAGQKPLYYAYQPGKQLQFASTLAPLVALGARSIERTSVHQYLRFGFAPNETSLLHGVKKLRPGHFAVVEAERLTERPHFDPIQIAERAQRLAPQNEDAAAERLLELLRDSVKKRLVSDVPIGAFLSAGVDSSLVVALAAEQLANPVKTFTIGFDDPRFDESHRASKIAEHLGAHQSRRVLRGSDVLDQLPTLIEALDEPMADYSSLPTIAVSRLARTQVTVALTGDGADELFGGYRYYVAQNLFDKYARAPQRVRQRIAQTHRWMPHAGVSRIVKRSGAADPHAFFARSGFYRGATSTAVAGLLGGSDSAEQQISRSMQSLPFADTARRGMLFDTLHTLPNAWLVKVDRCSMAFGLEARSPFLDKRVIEYSLALPLAAKIRGTKKKRILRRLLSRFVPKTMFEHPKQGFTAPVGHWMRHELRDQLRQTLAPSVVQSRGWVEPSVVTRLVDEHLAGRDHAQVLWALLMLEWWAQVHMEGGSTTGLFQ